MACSLESRKRIERENRSAPTDQVNWAGAGKAPLPQCDQEHAAEMHQTALGGKKGALLHGFKHKYKRYLGII